MSDRSDGLNPHDLLTGGESDRTEFKGSGVQAKVVGRSLCALANNLSGNAGVGVLVVGVDDAGVPDGRLREGKLRSALEASLRPGALDPTPAVTVTFAELQGRAVGILCVEPSPHRPVRFDGIVWVRTGSHTRIASDSEVKALTDAGGSAARVDHPAGEEVTHTRLSHLGLTNFRSFALLKLDFHPLLTVLVGQNGAGKTTVLDGAARALFPFLEELGAEAKGCYIADWDIRRRRSPENTMEPESFTEIAAHGFLAGTLVGWSRSRRGLTGSKTTSADLVALKSVAVRLKRDLDKYTDGKSPVSPVLPVIALYGTERLHGELRLTKGKRDQAQDSSRLAGYTDCLSPLSSYRSFAEWYKIYWELWVAEKNGAAPSGHSPRARLDAVQGAVDVALAESRWAGVEWDSVESDLTAAHPEQGRMPVSTLSNGIRTMVGLVGDLAHRCVQLNPQLGAEAAKLTPGVAMIDEIDMHLHPEWQQLVLPSLTSAFPRVQFIVTTHSPQVLSTVPSGCIRILTPEGVSSAPAGTEGAESSRVLKQVFGVESRPKLTLVARNLREYLDLVDTDAWDSDRAIELRTALDVAFDGAEPALFDADLRIENRKWELDR